MKNKKIIILVTIIIMLILGLSITYAMYTFNKTGGTSKLILGDIWMKYTEKEGISLQNVTPGADYSDYFEFQITGTNTYQEKDIWYDVILSNGDVPDEKNEDNRLDSKYLKFKLVEINGNEENVLFQDKSYNDLNQRKVYVSTIPKNTKEVYNKTYRLYMTISNDLIIGNTSESIMTFEEYGKAFASVKVNVTGDLNEKQMPNTMARLGSADAYKFWSDDIENVKSSIKEVNFIKLSNEEIDIRYNAATIKSDVTTVEEYPIKAWLEINEIDSTKYTMFVASEAEIYFPSNSSYMFRNFISVERFNFDNVDTSQVIYLSSMFAYCKNLTSMNLSNWNTANVSVISNMFMDCNNIVTLDLSNWDTSNVTYMFATFYNCNNLTSLDLSGWDTKNVSTMRIMFQGCSSLKELDVSNFDTSKVVYMEAMFDGCSSLESLDVSNWNTKNLVYATQMFNNCKSLKTLDLSTWDMSNVDNTRVMFQYVSKVTEIKLPNNIKTIGAYMFNHNYAATGDTFIIPKSVEEMGYSHMWYGFGTTFNEFVVEAGNTHFKTVDGVLYTADGTRLIAVPTHKTNMEKTLEIPEGVTFINENSFSTNKKLETLILPNSYVITRYVGKSNSAYAGDNVNTGSSLSIGVYLRTNIGTYIVKADNPNYISVDGCLYSKDGSELIAVPWQYNGALSIKDGTTKIGQEAFWTYGANSTSETTKLTSVHIPASVTTIESAQITALNKLVGRITITIDEANPNYTISAGKIVSK